jgi:hypothetical protein
MVPTWLHLLSLAALGLGLASAGGMALHEIRRPQRMWIMNLVWPISGLYAGPIAVWAYWRYGLLSAGNGMDVARQREAKRLGTEHTPFPAMVGKAAAHCGSGCTLGDLAAEWLAFTFPVVAVWFGHGSIFAEKVFAIWILDYIFAFSLGIVFQYFTIAPMRNLSVGQGVRAAVKADALSLTAWQIGMYGFMAAAQFYLFRTLLGIPLEVSTPEFWFMMQMAMIAGFLTSYPVNWWLLRSGVKEKM